MTPAEQARFDEWRREVAAGATPLSDRQIAILRTVWRPSPAQGNAAPVTATEAAPVHAPDHERYRNEAS